MSKMSENLVFLVIFDTCDVDLLELIKILMVKKTSF